MSEFFYKHFLSFGGAASKVNAWSKMQRTVREWTLKVYCEHTYQSLQQPYLPWDPEFNLYKEKRHKYDCGVTLK